MLSTARVRPPLRAISTALACAGAALAAAPSALAVDGNWNRPEQRAVVHAGVMAPASDGAFHGERRRTAAELRRALSSLAARVGTRDVGFTGRTVSVRAFDARLVAELGLGDVARAIRGEAVRAGLSPPGSFGTEVVARQLGLRVNHPAPADRDELFPTDRITRAEAAHSLARVLALSGWEVAYARQVLARFKLPRYTAAQRRVLRLAVSKIGMPYVWGGESDTTSSPYGPQAHGGYDCSGFAWRVFKLSGNPAGRRIGGRTAAQQAGEVPRLRRIAFKDVRPGDLLFFGPARFGDRATEAGIVHMGIALSGDFMIHSSSQGVFVSPLFEDWRRAEFSWARRVL